MLNLLMTYFAQLSYLIIGLAAFAEGSTLPCPSLVVLLMAGAATATNRVSFWLAVVIAAVSYTIGSLIPYMIGYHLPRLQKLPWVGRFIGASLQSLDQINCLFQRHGEKIVALARPFWIGNCVSYFAGLNRMPMWKFLSLTFLGISAWCTTAIYVGSIFGSNLAKAEAFIKHYSWVAFGIIVLVCCTSYALVHYLRYRQRVSTVRE